MLNLSLILLTIAIIINAYVWPALAPGLLWLTVGVYLFRLAFHFAPQPRWWHIAFRIIAGGALISAGVFAMFAYFEIWQYYDTCSISGCGECPYRITTLLTHPNPYMAYMNLAAPFAVMLLLRGTPRMRAISACWLALFAFTAYFSSSRGGLLGCVVWGGVMLCVWLYRGGMVTVRAWMKPERIPAIMLAGTAIGIVAVLAYHSVSCRFGGDITVPNGRNIMWEESLSQLPDNIWFGLGPFVDISMNGRFSGFVPNHAHNMFVTILTERGLIGFIPFMLFWACAWYYIIRAAWRSPSPWAIPLLAALASWQIHSLVDDFGNPVLPVIRMVALLAILAVSLPQNISHNRTGVLL